MDTNTTRKALLVMDIQEGILKAYPDVAAKLIPKLNTAIERAREAGIPVIFIRVAFRKGLPEMSTNNRFGAAMRERIANVEPADFIALHPGLDARDTDYFVEKRRISAFTGSDLEVLLRGLDVRHLVLTGVATSGVVLSTLREAGDKDFELTVLEDCCLDMDPEVHRVLTQKVFTRHAEVAASADWMP